MHIYVAICLFTYMHVANMIHATIIRGESHKPCPVSPCLSTAAYTAGADLEFPPPVHVLRILQLLLQRPTPGALLQQRAVHVVHLSPHVLQVMHAATQQALLSPAGHVP